VIFSNTFKVNKVNKLNEQNEAYRDLKLVMDSYSPISDDTWGRLKGISKFKQINKRDTLYRNAEIANSFCFVYSGLFRLFITDADGKEYNKNFFDEGTFPGSMVALLTRTPSKFTVEALEPSEVILIDFFLYRKLLFDTKDLMKFHILYLEKNWLLDKDAREVELVQKDASIRYQQFLKERASLSKRLSQAHIASHLGISPTQLSRIRKNK